MSQVRHGGEDCDAEWELLIGFEVAWELYKQRRSVKEGAEIDGKLKGNAYT